MSGGVPVEVALSDGILTPEVERGDLMGFLRKVWGVKPGIEKIGDLLPDFDGFSDLLFLCIVCIVFFFAEDSGN